MEQSAGLSHFRSAKDRSIAGTGSPGPRHRGAQTWMDMLTLACHVCGMPAAYLSLVDARQHKVIASLGIDCTEIHMEKEQCAELLSRGQQLFTADCGCVKEARLPSLPQGMTFFAGLPLQGEDGALLGTLCLLDEQPRTLSVSQQEVLLALARQLASIIEVDAVVARLQEKVECFESCLNSSPAIVTIKDDAGNYRYANAAFLDLIGKSAPEVLGKSDRQLWDSASAMHFAECDELARQQGASYGDAELIKRKNGDARYWQVHRFMLKGTPLLACVGLDVTDWKSNEQQLMASQELLRRSLASLEVLSVTDGLTGLHNRRSFEEKLKEEFERARRYNLPLSLLMLDADRFKEFNDSCGHPAGDHLLKEIALILKQSARANDLVARYGGDEFAVILPNTDSKVAFHLAERLRRATKMLCAEGRPVTISVGVAAMKPEIQDPHALLVAADNALYDAKRKGRNRVSHTAGLHA